MNDKQKKIEALKQKAFDHGQKMIASDENMNKLTTQDHEDFNSIINELNELDDSHTYTTEDFIPKA